MKKTVLIIAALALWSSMALAAIKTYQVTGPVVAVTNDMITVKKGNDNWEIARDKETKIKGDLKVGAKVTIEYRMTATAVDVKEEKAKPAKKK
jgi:hypothetical protein